jgi:transcription elongation factor Elf1
MALLGRTERGHTRAFEALRKARELEGPYPDDYWRNEDGIKCPHCGHMNTDTECLPYDENETEFSCGMCGEDFQIQVHVTYAWDTSESDEYAKD